MDILCFLLLVLIWGIACLFASFFAFLIGSFFEYALGAWFFWPGFVFGFFVFMYNLRPLLFFYNDSITVEPPKKHKSILPFILGLWLGIEFFDNEEK
ncbi:hypothetical protein [Desulforamulus hydrothermalis]|uniref:hypothetical protein n=1 Tax=Desulforamulus hydrothermalis TaxID=412895 RepID=UPI0002DA4AA2|nr:hypothetical protein [Desulforamulus hydrothermalis]